MLLGRTFGIFAAVVAALLQLVLTVSLSASLSVADAVVDDCVQAQDGNPPPLTWDRPMVCLIHCFFQHNSRIIYPLHLQQQLGLT